MGSLLMYLLGALLGIVMTVLRVPLAMLDGFLDLPGLAYVWGFIVWICSLFGDAGDTLITTFRLIGSIVIVYLPIWVIRKFWLFFRGTPPARNTTVRGPEPRYPF